MVHVGGAFVSLIHAERPRGDQPNPLAARTALAFQPKTAASASLPSFLSSQS